MLGSEQLIEGPSGQIQLDYAPGTTEHVMVICHPHPLYGGTMDNKVVSSVFRAFTDQGAAAVRFNYRGVGVSEGFYGDGLGETDDLFAVLDWLATRLPAAKLTLVGFSFGGYVAAAAADWIESGRYALDLKLTELLLIAPACTRFDMTQLSLPRSTRMILGDQDDVVDTQEQQKFAELMGLTPDVVSGAGHFFHGKLSRIKSWAAHTVSTESASAESADNTVSQHE